MRKEPIKTPFLTKSKERDFNEAIAVFKIILRLNLLVSLLETRWRSPSI